MAIQLWLYFSNLYPVNIMRLQHEVKKSKRKAILMQ
jgi:hypothetical protein